MDKTKKQREETENEMTNGMRVQEEKRGTERKIFTKRY
jgi:hypothetical protein